MGNVVKDIYFFEEKWGIITGVLHKNYNFINTDHNNDLADTNTKRDVGVREGVQVMPN